MKKNLFNLILVSIFLLLPVFILAAEDLIEPPDVKILGEGGVLDRIINYLFAILLAVAVIFILISAFNFVFAQGDAEKFKTAKRALLYAVIGVLVAFAAKGIVNFIGEVADTGARVTPTIAASPNHRKIDNYEICSTIYNNTRELKN